MFNLSELSDNSTIKNALNDTDNSTSTGDFEFCSALKDFYTNYLGFIIAGVGITFNTLNILVYAQPNMRDKQMNVYLLAKSVCDVVFLLRNMLINALECSGCPPTLTPGGQIFDWVFTYYIGFIMQLASMIFEALATFDRYAIITQYFPIYFKIKGIYFFIGTFGFSATFYIYKFFVFGIVTSFDNSTNITTYTVDYPTPEQQHISNMVGIAHSGLRDGICVAAIIVLNVLILTHTKRAFVKKRAMTTTNFSTSLIAKGEIQSSVVKHSSKADQVENRITTMVVLIGALTVVGHLPTLIYYIPVPAMYVVTKSDCYSVVSDTVYYNAYGLAFLFYYFFNNTFKKTLHRLAALLLCMTSINDQIGAITRTEQSQIKSPPRVSRITDTKV